MAINETTNIQLKFHLHLCRTKEPQNGGKEYISSLQYTLKQRVPIIKNWLGRQGLQLLETLAQSDEESLLETLGNRFNLQYHEALKLLYFCKLLRQHNESAEEWKDRLTI